MDFKKMTFRDARHAARMSVEQVTEYLELSPRTIARYETTGKAPKAVIECLLMLGGQFPRFNKNRNGFDGWSFGQGYLWSPAGERFTSGDILASRLDKQLVRALHKSNIKLRSEQMAIRNGTSNVIDFTLKRNKRR